MKIVWSPLALQRAEEIVHHIAQNNPSAAMKWVNLVFQKAKRLSHFPESGRLVPETDRSDLREIFYGCYRIIYRTKPNEVAVLTIRHGKQQLPKHEIA